MKQLQQVEIGKLRQLADYLRTIPPSQFDLCDWEVQAYVPAQTFLFGLIEVEPECGFVGCAMGWAAFSRLFPGLYLDGGGPAYKGYLGFEAVQELFGITSSSRAAEFLFAQERYAKTKQDPGHVADRLERYADKVESRLKRQMHLASPLEGVRRLKLELVA